MVLFWEEGESKFDLLTVIIKTVKPMFINFSGGVEMNGIFKGSMEDLGKTLLNLWDGFYEELKV